MTIFFLIQHIALQQLAAEPYSLNPPTKVSLKETDPCFKYLHDTISLALIIYRQDVIKQRPKETIIRNYGAIFSNISNVRFDLQHIDIGKKGWTRYYPFYVNGEQFIMRIFLTEESTFQPKAPVLYEGAIENPRVTFQMLPPLQEILKPCRIKPHTISLASGVDTSP